MVSVKQTNKIKAKKDVNFPENPAQAVFQSTPLGYPWKQESYVLRWGHELPDKILKI